MFNVSAMVELLEKAKKQRRALKKSFNSVLSSGNMTPTRHGKVFSTDSGVMNNMDESFFASINSSLQKDVSMLLSLPGLDAHSLWLTTAHDRKKLIKEVMYA